MKKCLLLWVFMMTVIGGLTPTCLPSEYQIDDKCCPRCPPGSRVEKHCTAFRSRSCVSCAEGTFMNQPTGRRQCFTCRTCDAGSGLKTKTSCTSTSDTVCEPQEGFYCMDPTEDGCAAAQKHTRCQPGQYISRPGSASEDTECSACTAGTFSDGTFTSCQQHRQCEASNLYLKKPGTASVDAECGEQSSNTTGIVIAVVVCVICVVLVLVAIRIFKNRRCKMWKEVKTVEVKCENGRAMAERRSLNKDTKKVAVNPSQDVAPQ